MRHHVSIALLVVAALGGRTSDAQTSATPQPPDPARVRALAGCYHLTLGAWSRSSRLGPPTPTSLFRLDSLPRRPGQPGDLLAERLAPIESLPPTDPRARWRQSAQWRLAGVDSLQIVLWSTGFEAEVLYGRAVGTALRGVVRRTSDAIIVEPGTRRILWNAYPWATAAADQVPCP